MPSPTPFRTEWLGRLPYAEAWALQKQYHREIAEGGRPPTLLLLEHPRTITLGRSTKSTSLLHSPNDYRRLGFDVFDVERGGDVTYHGPGQLVGYPLFPVVEKVGDYLRKIERALLAVLEQYQLPGRGSPGYAGIWVGTPEGEAKIASIGIAVSRRVSYHGFALNVSTDLDDFNVIVPCGLAGVRVTSLQASLGRPVRVGDVVPQAEQAFAAETWF
jgi:lipoyl(octanoyl) transferase